MQSPLPQRKSRQTPRPTPTAMAPRARARLDGPAEVASRPRVVPARSAARRGTSLRTSPRWQLGVISKGRQSVSPQRKRQNKAARVAVVVVVRPLSVYAALAAHLLPPSFLRRHRLLV